MPEERAGMRSTSRPGRSLFPTLLVYRRLALQTNLKSGVRIVTDERNPRLTAHPLIFAERRSVKNETAPPLCVGAPKDDAANLRRIVEARGGEVNNGGGQAARPP